MADSFIIVYLTTAAIWMALFTGCRGQCSFSSRPAKLFADTDRQSFSSPQDGFGKYPPNSYCAWVIEAPRDQRVRLRVLRMQVEYSAGCTYDSVTVFDGFYTNTNKIMDKICGSQYRTYYSSGNYLSVVFESDDTDEYFGFTLEYKAIHDDSLDIPNLGEHTTAPPMTTTTEGHSSWHLPFSTAALLGGLVGAVAIVLLLVGLCRYCLNRSIYRSALHPPHQTRASSGGQGRHGSGRVFTISMGADGRATPFVNEGFTPYPEGPPSYESLHFEQPANGGVSQQPDGGTAEANTNSEPPPLSRPPRPPSYDEVLEIINNTEPKNQ